LTFFFFLLLRRRPLSHCRSLSGLFFDSLFSSAKELCSSLHASFLSASPPRQPLSIGQENSPSRRSRKSAGKRVKEERDQNLDDDARPIMSSSARLPVVPTVTVLAVMKSRLAGAIKGHSLLKKKADALTIR